MSWMVSFDPSKKLNFLEATSCVLFVLHLNMNPVALDACRARFICPTDVGHCSSEAIRRSAIDPLAPPTFVTVVNNSTLSYILNMADSVASSVIKNLSLLEHIPNSISVDVLPNSKGISSKSLDKGLNYFLQGYIHEIEFSRNQNFVSVSD